MANWSNPQLTSTYTNFLAEVKARDVDLATQFSGSPTNVPTGAIKWDSGSNIWQKWSGSAWGELTSTYQFPAITATTGTFSSNVSVTGTLDSASTVSGQSFSCDGSTAPSNGIYLPAASTLGFSAGGSRQAALTSTGLKLGSGTAGCKLDVVGGIKVSGGITNGSHGYGFSSNDTDGGMYSNADNELTFKTNDTRRLTIQGDQVGVNINNPDAHLHVCNTNTNNSTLATSFKISNSEGSYKVSVDGDYAFHNADTYWIQNEAASSAYGVWNATGLGVNCVPGSYKFEVSGSAKISASLRVGSLLHSDGSSYKPNDLSINATNRVLYQASTSDTVALGVGTAGQFLRTNGASSAPSWETISTAGVVPIGGIIAFKGTNAPSGWVLCDNSTAALNAGAPDLRNRFIVGTGDTYSLGNEGGSANAVTTSHTHYITDNAGSHQHGLTDPGHDHTYARTTNFASGGGDASNRRAPFQETTTDTSTKVTGITISSGGGHNHSMSTTGVSGTNKNLPPYYALAYIMRVS